MKSSCGILAKLHGKAVGPKLIIVRDLQKSWWSFTKSLKELEFQLAAVRVHDLAEAIDHVPSQRCSKQQLQSCDDELEQG